MAKLSRKAFTRKKLTGTIDDYPLVKVTTLDWVSHSELQLAWPAALSQLAIYIISRLTLYCCVRV